MSWVIYTIAATILQTFRNLEQKSLNKKLDSLTVSWSRFILPLPFAISVMTYTFSLVSKWFIFYCFITALFQIAGNIFLLQTFKSRNFSIGIAFYKTEVLQASIIGLLFFNITLSISAFIAILVATTGVIFMSGLVLNGGSKKFIQSFCNKSALYGLLTGFCFSISAFNLKFASEALSIPEYSYVKIAVIILMWVICFQNIFFTVVKLCQNRLKKDLRSLVSLEHKYTFLKTSILSFCGSVCWFTAFGLGKVVYVKAVGQIELVIAVAVSYLVLKEKLKISEIIGIILTSGSILWLIFNTNHD